MSNDSKLNYFSAMEIILSWTVEDFILQIIKNKYIRETILKMQVPKEELETKVNTKTNRHSLYRK